MICYFLLFCTFQFYMQHAEWYQNDTQYQNIIIILVIKSFRIEIFQQNERHKLNLCIDYMPENVKYKQENLEST